MEYCERQLSFPFSAVVGQEEAKTALLCVAVNPLIGGVLLKGDKGTGKSTLVRSLTNILPEIEVVADCEFRCNPNNPLEMCDDCYERFSSNEKLPVEKRKMSFVNLPLSITIDRLIGTIDVTKFLKEGKKALNPGLMAEANRGVLYIDEVNLLDDYIADSLLDAAAMGWNTIEREGISFRHPARFILVGSMNPEEGELRPQILDRFGLCVEISAPMNPEERIEIVRRTEEFQKDPVEFYEKYKKEEEELTKKIVKARELLPKVKVDEDLLELLAETIIKLGIKTNRAEIATIKTAKSISALDGRKKVSMEDIEKAMELTLKHRLKDKPFQRRKEGGKSLPKTKFFRSRIRSSKKQKLNRSSDREDFGSRRFDDTFFPPLKTEVPEIDSKKKIKFSGSAHRSSRDITMTTINQPKGIPVAHIPLSSNKDESANDIDLYNSIIHAMLRERKLPVKFEKDDIRIRVRRVKAPTLWVIILDSSGSMAVKKRIRIAKGIAEKLIEDGYTKRSKMAFILAKGFKSEIVVPPTKNYWQIVDEIERAPTGGRTPLSSALQQLISLSKREKMKEESLKVKAFMITDGRANVPLTDDIEKEMVNLAKNIKKEGIELYIYDTSVSGIYLGVSCIPILKEICNAKVQKV
ncbi:magnesium chelatase ChlI subunit [Methanothermus fervidus DSM 2088]|uniref:Magnesium chelatase ChlI subunit n=1 Tax=Methanothermus fervidus (strain ATCC 43054 / DSM 2088 / JCM 10308 / V24 S) TaxID=523846 RepID=E3GXD1_METFV|nr:ATP-binding protein [Methanothermus fervidus]ADP76963.1 magnesium chelatase ChlI subunit [Methanothermus fervidus DSM 2088]